MTEAIGVVGDSWTNGDAPDQEHRGVLCVNQRQIKTQLFLQFSAPEDGKMRARIVVNNQYATRA